MNELLFCFWCLCFRAEASVGRLAELNPYVEVKTLSVQLNIDSALEFLDQYQVMTVFAKYFLWQMSVIDFYLLM